MHTADRPPRKPQKLVSEPRSSCADVLFVESPNGCADLESGLFTRMGVGEMSDALYVGIDVSKARLDVYWHPTGETRSEANNELGIEALVSLLVRQGPARVVVEATGGLETAFSIAAGAAGLPLAVVNPRQVRDLAKATGRLAKTDTLDAAAIALFAALINPKLSALRDEETAALASLVTRRRQLVSMRVQEKNRLAGALVTMKDDIKSISSGWMNASRTSI